jgi:beta-N-acetylhexosaminidase
VSPRAAAILGVEGLALTGAERAFLTEAQPFGFILFARNIETPDQVRRLTAELREAVGWDAPVLIDQEGGRVQRMRPPHWRLWLPPLEQMARAGDLEEAARAMFLRHRLMAHELRAVGIDVNCAPMADLARDETHPFLRNRCFGEDTASVVTGARAASEGLLAGGVLPVLKHLPGHGRARSDSHLELPVVDASVEELRTTDFAPFAALADLPMGMTAHVRYTALDASRPATQSSHVIGVIRDEIGFGGLLMSDDLSMQALAGGIGSRAATSIAAGCDVVLHCNGEMAEMEAAVEAAGTLAGPSQVRAESALARRVPPEPFDMCAAEAELERLLEGKVHG